MSIVDVLIPDFMTETRYSSQREKVLDHLVKHNPCTSRELHAEIGDMYISDVRARLSELVDDHEARVVYQGTCDERSDDREVNVYEPTAAGRLEASMR